MSQKNYTVSIIEESRTLVTVLANNEAEAKHIAEERQSGGDYNEGDILRYDDQNGFMGWEVEGVEENEEMTDEQVRNHLINKNN